MSIEILQQTEQFVPEKRDPRALNAFRHGLTGRIHITTQEQYDAYTALCTRITADLKPVGGMEETLVQSICDDHWRQQSAFAYEEAIMASGISETGRFHNQAAGTQDDQIDTAMTAGQVWVDNSKSLALISLYSQRYHRRSERNLQTLRQLQAERKAALEQAAQEIAQAMEAAASKGQTFDPKTEYPFGTLSLRFEFSAEEIIRRAVFLRRLKPAQHRKFSAKAA